MRWEEESSPAHVISLFVNAGDRCVAVMVQTGKATPVGTTPHPELCEFTDHLFCFFLCMCRPLLALWPCQLFTTGRKKKNLFHACGKAEIGWDQALLEIWEADIKSTLFLSCSGSPEALLLAFSKSWFLPLSNLLWYEDLTDSCPTGEQILRLLRLLVQRLNQSHGRRLGLWTQLWRHDRLAHITQSAVPLTMETSGMSDCEKILVSILRG